MKTEQYLDIVKSIAKASKDSTKVGAVLIGPDGEGGPWGYNGAPRGCSADESDDLRNQRPEKYYWLEHAERNAIYTAARTGFKTIGCTMVITHPPCMDCARAIVQAGIKKVLFIEPTEDFIKRWEKHVLRSLKLFEECGVQIEVINEA